ncbi:MAG: chloride channel protein [Bacteroidales bacterium]|nr:chloride channel protein [Bacteroidales bacterium]
MTHQQTNTTTPSTTSASTTTASAPASLTANQPTPNSYKRLKRYAKILAWRQLHITDSGFVLLLSVVVGLLSGIAAWLLKLMISTIAKIASEGHTPGEWNWIYLILPVIGITLAGLFCRYLLKANVSNGVKKMVDDLNNKQYQLSPKTIYGSLIASSLTLGMGGTAGSEGPIAYAGAGIGSGLGRIFRLSPQLMAILVGCGAGAGIAGIFKAPVGGALFTLEVLRVELSTIAVIGVFLATLVAALTAYALSGCTLDINVVSPGAFDNHTLLWAVALGIVCGLYSLYYTKSGGMTRHLLDRMSSPWLKYLTSGLAIGVMILLFPSLYGEGYGAITKVINGNSDTLASAGALSHLELTPWLIVAICGGMLLFKGIGSSATNNGGGVAGDFAPTLFAGCMLGLMFALALNTLHVTDLNTAHYALIGMAGAMAGIIRAPLMAMFLTTEMVGGFEFLLPAAVVALISYCIVMIFKRDTFYHSQPYISPQQL